MPELDRTEWLSLDNFCRTHPVIRKLLQFLYTRPDEEYTVESATRESGMVVSFLDLKSLYVYKVLEAFDSDGNRVPIAWDLDKSCRYRLRKEKIPLIQAVLEKRTIPE